MVYAKTVKMHNFFYRLMCVCIVGCLPTCLKKHLRVCIDQLPLETFDIFEYAL